MNTVTLDQIIVGQKCLLALECMYNVTMMLVKMSFCYLYLRLFPMLKYRVWAVAAFVVAWCISFIFVCLFRCTPMAKVWDPLIEGTCLDPGPVFVTNAALNFASDIALLCMPISQVIKLELKMAVKISLCSVFMLGAL